MSSELLKVVSSAPSIVRQAMQAIIHGRSPFRGREVSQPSFVRKLVLVPPAEIVSSSEQPIKLDAENRLLQRIDSSFLSTDLWMCPGDTAKVETMGVGVVRVVYQLKNAGELYISRSKLTNEQLKMIPKEILQRDKEIEDFYNKSGVAQMKFGILTEANSVEASQGFDVFGKVEKSKVQNVGKLMCPRLEAELRKNERAKKIGMIELDLNGNPRKDSRAAVR